MAFLWVVQILKIFVEMPLGGFSLDWGPQVVAKLYQFIEKEDLMYVGLAQRIGLSIEAVGSHLRGKTPSRKNQAA